MLQSLKVIDAILWICSFWSVVNVISGIPRVLSKMMTCRFKNPALYLFQSKISRYFDVLSCLHWYLIILFRRWISFFFNALFFTKSPFAPLYRIWITLSCLRPNFKLIYSTKFYAIFPIPSVYSCPLGEYASSISLSIIFFPSNVQEAEKLWPIRAALLAGFSMESKSPKKESTINLVNFWKGPWFWWSSLIYQREDDLSWDGDHPKGMYLRPRMFISSISFLKIIFVIYFWFLSSVEFSSWIATLRKSSASLLYSFRSRPFISGVGGSKRYPLGVRANRKT